jgi:hypothetical protein
MIMVYYSEEREGTAVPRNGALHLLQEYKLPALYNMI